MSDGYDDRRAMPSMNETTSLVVMYGTLTVLGMLCCHLLWVAMNLGAMQAVRSLAALLLPMTLASFVYLFNRDPLRRLSEVGAGIGFMVSVLLGIGVMLALRYFMPDGKLPLAELITSGVFSLLAFLPRAPSEQGGVSYYYGVLTGMLVYVVLCGFPLLG